MWSIPIYAAVIAVSASLSAFTVLGATTITAASGASCGSFLGATATTVCGSAGTCVANGFFGSTCQYPSRCSAHSYFSPHADGVFARFCRKDDHEH